eukprot:12913271-Prorocentrum_lima.AAC.1
MVDSFAALRPHARGRYTCWDQVKTIWRGLLLDNDDDDDDDDDDLRISSKDHLLVLVSLSV